MSQSSSQLSSGNIAPTIKEPEKDTKEVFVLGGVVLFIGGLLAAAWIYGQGGDQAKMAPATEKIEKTKVLNQASASITYPTEITTPMASTPDILHADIYFEVGRKGLTDEGKAQLVVQADVLKQHEDYGVLVQGYTDQQGSANYNKQLGMKRAEAVKAELVNAGIAEHRIKAVSLGKEAVLCADTSDICRHMNRRVHLEVRKIGQEHMALPPVPATTSESPSSDPSPTIESGGSTTESVPSSPSDPTTALEPASGS